MSAEFEQYLHGNKADPLAQRFRFRPRDRRAVFHTAEGAAVLAQDIDRGWWGLFPLPEDYHSQELIVSTEPPIAIVSDGEGVVAS